jgi:hypothetical protein
MLALFDAVPMRRSILTSTLSAGLLVTASAPASAAEGRGGEIGLLGGAAFPDQDVAGEQGPSSGPSAGVRVASVFSRRWTIFVDALVSQIDSEAGFGDLTCVAGRTGAEYRLWPEWRFPVFVGLGAGWMALEFDDPSADFDRPFLSAGGGQRFTLSDRFGLRWELRTDHTVDDSGLGGVGVTQGRFLLGLLWGPGVGGGGAAPRADSDADGVRDGHDACSATPAGVEVDARGCPIDSDRDGVWDGADRCPDSPDRARVGPDGCPPDSDGDGVGDDSDACPRTPSGIAVDDWGCPRDTDRDGVPEELDRCPATRAGARVDAQGCELDGDGDGVPDGLDRCVDTPPGAEVDETGCGRDPDRR